MRIFRQGMQVNRNIRALLWGAVLIASQGTSAGQNVYSDATSQEVIQKKRNDYGTRLKALEAYRQQQAQRYRNAQEGERGTIVIESRQRLTDALVQDVFPAWYGTDWAFHGTSTKPGEGKIACGYFVSTCLTHVGYQVDRIKLAQQPSQWIIETFMAPSERNIMAGGKPMDTIRHYLRNKGNGIYIVGLDSHVGFVSVQGDDMAFIHSNYYEPDSFVKSERIDSKNPLSDSKYRVFGKIFSDEMIGHWLTGHKYEVKTR